MKFTRLTRKNVFLMVLVVLLALPLAKAIYDVGYEVGRAFAQWF